MPIYEYRCRECATVFEKLQKLSDPPLAVCEACGAPVDKLVSQTAFAFKGTGWYVTDYAKNPRPAASKDGDSEKAAAAKADKGEGQGRHGGDRRSRQEAGAGGRRAKKPEPAAVSRPPRPAAAPASAPAASSTPNG